MSNLYSHRVDGLLDVTRLTVWKIQEDDDIRDFFEERVGIVVSEFFGTTLHHVTKGDVPEYDVQLCDGTRLEIKKVSSFGNAFIETDQEKNVTIIDNGKTIDEVIMRPSGISLSKSHYYVFVSPGTLKGTGEVFRVWIIPTTKIREFIKDNKLIKHRLVNDKGKESLGYRMNMKSVYEEKLVGYFKARSNTIISLFEWTKWRGKPESENYKYHKEYIRNILDIDGLKINNY